MFTVPGTPPPGPTLSCLEASRPDLLPADGFCMITPEAKLPKLANLLSFRPHLPCDFLAWSDGTRIAVSSPAGRLGNAFELPIGGVLDSKTPITGLFACSGPRPWLLALAGSQAGCWGVTCVTTDPKATRSGVPVAKWTARSGEAWRAAAWHPSLDVAAIVSQRQVCVVCPESQQTPNDSKELISTSRGGQVFAHLDAPEDGRNATGRVSVAWADDSTLVVAWATHLELIRWRHRGGRGEASKAEAWKDGQYERREMLLGTGTALRALACEAGGAVVGTLDAPVALSPSGISSSSGHSLISESLTSAIMTRGSLQLPEAGTDVLDLRGQLRQVETPEVSVPAAFLLNSSPVAEARAAAHASAQAARIVAFWPQEIELHAGPLQEGRTHPKPSCVLPLALPMPDILRVCGSVAAVASSVGPPAVQLFSVQREGLEPITNVILTLNLPNPSGQPPADAPIASRLRGLELEVSPVQKGRGTGVPRASLRVWGLQAKRIVEDVAFSSSTTTASLSLSYHTVPLDAKFFPKGQQTGPEDVPKTGSKEGVPCAVQPPTMSGQDSSDAQAIVTQLAQMISALQVHLDSRLDSVEKSLQSHEGRLSRIEGSVRASWDDNSSRPH